MKKISTFWVPQSLKFTCSIFRSLEKGRMWWYNILGGNKGSVYILQYLLIFLHYIFPNLIN